MWTTATLWLSTALLKRWLLNYFKPLQGSLFYHMWDHIMNIDPSSKYHWGHRSVLDPKDPNEGGKIWSYKEALLSQWAIQLTFYFLLVCVILPSAIDHCRSIWVVLGASWHILSSQLQQTQQWPFSQSIAIGSAARLKAVVCKHNNHLWMTTVRMNKSSYPKLTSKLLFTVHFIDLLPTQSL